MFNVQRTRRYPGLRAIVLTLMLAVAMPIVAQAPAPELPPWLKLWNDFAQMANEWGQLAERRSSIHEINAREYVLWERMKKKWPEVRKAVDQTY